MDVFTTQSYRDVLELFLAQATLNNRGSAAMLAEHLKVHPTFISKVRHGASELSFDQSVTFCEFARFSREETDYFIDLVQHDRARTRAAKDYLRRRLERQLERRTDSRSRLHVGSGEESCETEVL